MKKFLFILSDNYCLKSSRECLEIYKGGKKSLSLPYSYIEQVIIFSFIPVSSKVFLKFSKYKIPYHILTKYGIYVGSYFPEEIFSSNITCKILQYKNYFDNHKKIQLAKFFVERKLKNFSKYFNVDFEIFFKRLNKAKKLTKILNIEALATKDIYNIYKGKLNKYNINFKKRDYYPPKDPGNAILSFSFNLFYNIITPLLLKEGFDIFISFLHIKRGKHKALVSDFMECIRPVIMKEILNFLEKEKEIKFIKLEDKYYLSKESIKSFLNYINNTMENIMKDFETSTKLFKDKLKNI